MSRTTYSQGNIVLVRINELPPEAIIQQGDMIVHEETFFNKNHKLSRGEVYRQQMDDDGCIGYIVAYNDCVISHDFYPPIKPMVGMYKVVMKGISK